MKAKDKDEHDKDKRKKDKKDKRAKRRLRDIRPYRVDLVDRAANQTRFLIFKEENMSTAGPELRNVDGVLFTDNKFDGLIKLLFKANNEITDKYSIVHDHMAQASSEDAITPESLRDYSEVLRKYAEDLSVAARKVFVTDDSTNTNVEKASKDIVAALRSISELAASLADAANEGDVDPKKLIAALADMSEKLEVAAQEEYPAPTSKSETSVDSQTIETAVGKSEDKGESGDVSESATTDSNEGETSIEKADTDENATAEPVEEATVDRSEVAETSENSTVPFDAIFKSVKESLIGLQKSLGELRLTQDAFFTEVDNIVKSIPAEELFADVTLPPTVVIKEVGDQSDYVDAILKSIDGSAATLHDLHILYKSLTMLQDSITTTEKAQVAEITAEQASVVELANDFLGRIPEVLADHKKSLSECISRLTKATEEDPRSLESALSTISLWKNFYNINHSLTEKEKEPAEEKESKETTVLNTVVSLLGEIKKAVTPASKETKTTATSETVKKATLAVPAPGSAQLEESDTSDRSIYTYDYNSPRNN